VIRFLRIRLRQLGLNASLFFIFGGVALAIAGPKVAAGFREAAPPLPALTPIVGPVSRVTDGDTFWIGRQDPALGHRRT
jgi:hypothetical protein